MFPLKISCLFNSCRLWAILNSTWFVAALLQSMPPSSLHIYLFLFVLSSLLLQIQWLDLRLTLSQYWRRKWQPTPVPLPGKFHGQRSLLGYSPWGCKESDMTEWLTHTYKKMDKKSLMAPTRNFRSFRTQKYSYFRRELQKGGKRKG